MSAQFVYSQDSKEFDEYSPGINYGPNFKRRSQGMAETDSKRVKLEVGVEKDQNSSLPDDSSVNKDNIQENLVINCESSNGENSTSDAEQLYSESNVLTSVTDLLSNTNSSSLSNKGSSANNLNNNNVNAINLNAISNQSLSSLKTTGNNYNNLNSNDSSSNLNEAGSSSGCSTSTSANLNPASVNPSHVVHVRNLPTDITELELLNFGSLFGRTINCLVLKGKNQAFIEFADLESAKSMVNLWQQHHNNNKSGLANNSQLPTVKGRQVFVQYSNHKKLKTNENHNNGQHNQSIKSEFNNYLNLNNSSLFSSSSNLLMNNSNNANHSNNNPSSANNSVKDISPTSSISPPLVSSAISSSNSTCSSSTVQNQISTSSVGGFMYQSPSTQTNSLPASKTNGTSYTMSKPSAVLRVIVENMVYVVPLETFHELFSRFGKVTKIVTFNKKGTFQVLIQFENSANAAAAKAAFDKQQMFPTGNLLRIEYSKLSKLIVKYNNDKSRDFTTSLPVGVVPIPVNNMMNTVGGPMVANNGMNPNMNPNLSHQQLALAAAAASATQHYPMEQVIDPLTLANIPGFSNLSNTLQYNNIRNGLSGSAASVHQHNSALNVLQSQGGMGLTSVLLVANLNEKMATPDALFTLFGVYGDVTRVKILFNKKDNALVQMAEYSQAQLVISFLDKIKFFGKMLRISMSKYSIVQMPKEGQPDSGLTKDFTNSSLHRFKKPGSKNYNNIFPPSATLHLSNIPSSCTEEQLRNAFETIANTTVEKFKFFPNDQKMALIQLPSVEDAIFALIKLHNHKLAESNHLRVSFSKSGI